MRLASNTIARLRTSINVAKVWRLMSYSKASEHVASLRKIIVDDFNDVILTGNIEKYTVDWTKMYSGGSVVARPKCINQLSTILRYCNDHTIGTVPQGGNTGLVGGQVGIGDQLVISIERLNSIISLDRNSNIVVVEAGCTLDQLICFADANNLIVPLDLGSKGSCQIGGNVATNAGGLRFFRYGSLHQNIIGLEAVLANGEVLDMLRTMRKDNCGYHLKNLFIGSEGTLGVITKVAMQLVQKPAYATNVLVLLRDYSDIPSFLGRCRYLFGETLSAVEFMDYASVEILDMTFPGVVSRLPKSLKPKYLGDKNSTIGEVLVLVEISSAISVHQSRIIEVFESPSCTVLDGSIAQDVQHWKEFWRIRETIPVALMNFSRKDNGGLFKYDISLPVLLVPDFVRELKEKSVSAGLCVCDNILPGPISTPGVEIIFCCFGHVGDENLHLNCVVRAGEAFSSTDLHQVKKFLDIAVYRGVHRLGGSISAEHGIGQQKVEQLELVRSSGELRIMKGLKNLMDPRRILNPGKLFRD